MLEFQSPYSSLLMKMALFRGLNVAQIEGIAARFEPVQCKEGEPLFSQGERGGIFYIIVSGKILLSRGQAGSQRLEFTLSTGDYLGEEPLLYNRPHSMTATALEACELLRLGKEQFYDLLQEFPQIKPILGLSVQTWQLALRKQIPLGENETLYLMARKTRAYLLILLVPPLLLAWVSVLFFFLTSWIKIPSVSLVAEWIGIALIGTAILWGIWRWLDWGNDYYIVTNLRVIWLEKVIGIYDSRQEAPLAMVLTVNVTSDQIGRWLGYGDVLVRTYTGQIMMRHIGYYVQFSNLLEEQLARSKEFAKKAETAALELEIKKRLGIPVEQAQQKSPAPTRPPQAPKKRFLGGLFEDFVKVRYEESGVVTFRKHWILLLRKIWLPTLCIIAVIFLIVARALGWYGLLTPYAMLVVGFTFLVIIFLWWLYQYVDWRNDIYQLNNEQIVDIYRKPLGREDKKTASLENILSLEHERIGLIGLLLNYGNVTAMVGTTPFVFTGVYNPAEVEQEIFHRINLRKRMQKEAEDARERARIADWLAAYHRQSETIRKSENRPESDGETG